MELGGAETRVWGSGWVAGTDRTRWSARVQLQSSDTTCERESLQSESQTPTRGPTNAFLTQAGKERRKEGKEEKREGGKRERKRQTSKRSKRKRARNTQKGGRGTVEPAAEQPTALSVSLPTQWCRLGVGCGQGHAPIARVWVPSRGPQTLSSEPQGHL